MKLAGDVINAQAGYFASRHGNHQHLYFEKWGVTEVDAEERRSKSRLKTSSH
jgi:hypothetical protein